MFCHTRPYETHRMHVTCMCSNFIFLSHKWHAHYATIRATYMPHKLNYLIIECVYLILFSMSYSNTLSQNNSIYIYLRNITDNTHLPGIYLPLLWGSECCIKSPVVLGYTRGHFSALVGIHGEEGESSILLPLTDSQHQPLPLHFITEEEVRVFVLF